MQLSVIQNKIFEVRGQKVMLDADLAAMYEVETKRLKEAVKRNLSRFPKDLFQALRSQTATSNRGGTRYLPSVFTEQGVAMLSSVLNSEKAIDVNIAIIRTFVLIRQSVINYKELNDKLKKLEKKYNKNFKEVFAALDYLITKKKEDTDFKDRKRIGFKAEE